MRRRDRPCDTDRMRQPYGPGDIIEIEVIDAEPGVFGPSDAARPARIRPRRPPWLVPTAIGVAAACGAVAMAWRPWEHPPDWRTFGPAAPASSTLSVHLIIDLAGVNVTSTHEGQNLATDEPTTLGHVFAVPGGSYDFDTWALFHSRGSNAARESVSHSTDVVHGLQAQVRHVRVRTTVAWGPVGGNYWDSETNRLDRHDAMGFANAVSVIAGLPAVAYDFDLGDLQPLGDVKTLARVQVLAAYVNGEPVVSKVSPTMLTYLVGHTPVTVASIGTGTDGLAMARFYLGQGRNVTVHGLPGAIIETHRIGKTVVWHEGDRLIVVAADGTDAELVAMAQAVRTASAQEWDRVLAADAPAVTDLAADITTIPFYTTRPSETIASGTLLDGSAYRVSITLGSPTVICAHVGPDGSSRGSCVYATPLSPATNAIHDDVSGADFVVAVVPPDSAQVLRITAATGEVSVAESQTTLSDSSFAMVTSLPPGATYELVQPA